MQITRAIIVAALCGLVAPALGQDILAPIQDMVDGLTPKSPADADAGGDEPPVPRPRPPSLPQTPEVIPPERPFAPAAETEPGAELPAHEPERIYQVACPAVITGVVEAQMVPPLSDGACGERSPLVVTAVLSRGRMVPLSNPVTTNCQMASALLAWVEDVDGYAEAVLESPLADITTGTSYMCRPRNSAETQFTSEHGFANAVDIVGFALEDGRKIAVQPNWMPAAKPEGRLLRLAHDAACGDFMTVLGPEANAEHADHLHLDMGCHGESCQARICQ